MFYFKSVPGFSGYAFAFILFAPWTGQDFHFYFTLFTVVTEQASKFVNQVFQYVHGLKLYNKERIVNANENEIG